MGFSALSAADQMVFDELVNRCLAEARAESRPFDPSDPGAIAAAAAVVPAVATAKVSALLQERVNAGDRQAERIFIASATEGLASALDEEEADGGPIRNLEDAMARLARRVSSERAS